MNGSSRRPLASSLSLSIGSSRHNQLTTVRESRHQTGKTNHKVQEKNNCQAGRSRRRVVQSEKHVAEPGKIVRSESLYKGRSCQPRCTGSIHTVTYHIVDMESIEL